MDSKAAITCQPCYYTHHHSVRGCGRHTSPLVMPCTVLAGKTTANRYNYTDTAHQECFSAAAPLPVLLTPHCTDAVQCCLIFPLVSPTPQQTSTVQTPWHIPAPPQCFLHFLQSGWMHTAWRSQGKEAVPTTLEWGAGLHCQQVMPLGATVL